MNFQTVLTYVFEVVAITGIAGFGYAFVHDFLVWRKEKSMKNSGKEVMKYSRKKSSEIPTVYEQKEILDKLEESWEAEANNDWEVDEEKDRQEYAEWLKGEFGEMTVKQLKEQLKEQGVTGYSRLRKKELVDKLVELETA